MFTGHLSSDADYRTWLEGIKQTHERLLRIRVLDLDHNVKSDTLAFGDGQVTIDVNRTPRRMLNLRLVDPSLSIGWEPDTASSLPASLRRMVRVDDLRAIPGLGLVECPVFTGPVTTDFDRDGADVSLVAHGKDARLGEFPRNHEWSSKRKVSAVMREILTDWCGEAGSRIHIPDLSATLPKKLVVKRGDSIKKELDRLANAVNRVWFYDARGHFVLRRAPKSPSLTIGSDSLTAPVRIDRELGEWNNKWIILGPKPDGDKKRISAELALPKNHPLSAQSLGRGTPNVPYWQVWEEENSHLKDRDRAREIVRDKRDDQMHARNGYSVECLPFPHIEEYDLVKAVDPDTGPVRLRVKQATIPLLAGSMSLGSIRKVSLVKRGGK